MESRSRLTVSRLSNNNKIYMSYLSYYSAVFHFRSARISGSKSSVYRNKRFNIAYVNVLKSAIIYYPRFRPWPTPFFLGNVFNV